MNQVFLVSEGHYSDYRIHSVWSDEEEAKKVAKMIRGNVEPRTLNESTARLGVVYNFHFNPDGEVIFSYVDSSGSPNDVMETWEDESGAVEDEQLKRIYVAVFSDSEEKALKIAYDKRAEFLAKKAGI